MSFREKSAWITLVTVIACMGAYYAAILSGLVKSHSMPALYLALGCILALIVLQAGLTLIAMATTPKHGRGPRDDREKLIQARSHTIGYYTLMVATASLFIPTHTRGVTMIDIVNYALMCIVISALVVAVAQIVMFRRGY
jgi:hypothetical protein